MGGWKVSGEASERRRGWKDVEGMGWGSNPGKAPRRTSFGGGSVVEGGDSELVGGVVVLAEAQGVVLGNGPARMFQEKHRVRVGI